MMVLLDLGSVSFIIWHCQANKENFTHTHLVIDTQRIISYPDFAKKVGKGIILFWLHYLFQKHVEGWQIFVELTWLEVMVLPQDNPGIFFSLWNDDLWMFASSLRAEPCSFLGTSQPLCAWLNPLGRAWCSCLQRSPKLLLVRKENGRW